MARVLLAMSGGVDSSVSAYLLQQQGYEVVGLFMRSGATEASSCSSELTLPVVSEKPARKQGCCSASDAADARRMADSLDIPFYAVDFADEFSRIKEYFVEEYTQGRTPNPCVMCNNWLKFGRLWDYALQIGADWIATGHYARVNRQPDGGYSLVRGVDLSKDQSYVLYGIRKELLPHLLFPVGSHSKTEIREIARKIGSRVAEKPDSQEICFIPDNNYQHFIRNQLPDFDGSGDLVDTEGNVVARHEGFDRYTIGQRKGLGHAFGERRYVVEIDASEKKVVVGRRDDLLKSTLVADQLNWLTDPPTAALRCEAKIRYLHTAAPATVEVEAADTARLTFDEPQSAIAPGQAVVFYRQDRVLGGGIIQNTPSPD